MNSLQIWLEATHLFMSPTRHQSGIGYYTENIIRSLIQLDHEDSFTIMANLFATNKPHKLQIQTTSQNYNYKFIRFIPGKVWNQLIKKKMLPPVNLLAGKAPDVMVNFDFVRLPVSSKTKTVTVIHDLTFLHFPQFIESKNLARLHKFVPQAIQHSDQIVAVSEYTKRDIVKHYKVDPQKVSVVSNAVNHKQFYPHKLSQQTKNKYQLPAKYVLYVGNMEPRKNIAGIVKAFAKLPQELQSSYPLVLAGGKGWNDAQLQQAITNSSAHEHIHAIGYVDDKDLAELYSGASVFVFPSFFEGFGLPVLEAMACGTPVITSHVSALPEAGGTAACYVDPNKIMSISRAIKEVITDKKLQTQMIKKGLEHSKKFSWEQSAGQMLNAIRKAAK